MQGEKITPALLTQSELEWLQGNKEVSKSFEWKMKSEIRRKLRTFQSLELPLLMDNGFGLTTNCKFLTISGKVDSENSNLSYITSSTNPPKGPSPSQDRVLIF